MDIINNIFKLMVRNDVVFCVPIKQAKKQHNAADAVNSISFEWNKRERLGNSKKTNACEDQDNNLPCTPNIIIITKPWSVIKARKSNKYPQCEYYTNL